MYDDISSHDSCYFLYINIYIYIYIYFIYIYIYIYIYIFIYISQQCFLLFGINEEGAYASSITNSSSIKCYCGKILMVMWFEIAPSKSKCFSRPRKNIT